MFTIERTDIKPAFGKTLKEVLCEYNTTNVLGFNHRYGTHQFLNLNPYAIKILEQNPEYIYPDILCRNVSQDSFNLLQTLNIDISHYISALSRFYSKTLDAYLHAGQIHDYLCKIGMLSVNLRCLSTNPRAIPFLERHMDLIEWDGLSSNHEAIDILERFQEKINYEYLTLNQNPRAMSILREHKDKIKWDWLSSNSCDEAIDILIENPQNINYMSLACNKNPRAIEILMNNVKKISWELLSGNHCTKAVQLLKEHSNKIDWNTLCCEAKTKEQFDLIRSNLGKVRWEFLCFNPSELAVKLLEEHPEKIVWGYSLRYQNVFETITTYDYAGIRGARHDLHQEFHAWAGHPSMITKKWKDWGFDTYGLDEAEEAEAEA
jgi:hypothetical protein